MRKKVEDDPPAVGRDVDGHPRTLVGLEVDLAGLAPREGDVPLGGVIVALLREGVGGEGSGGGGRESEQERGEGARGGRALHGCLRDSGGRVRSRQNRATRGWSATARKRGRPKAHERNSSRGRTRTCDKTVNSRLLYQLSYAGMDGSASKNGPGGCGSQCAMTAS